MLPADTRINDCHRSGHSRNSCFARVRFIYILIFPLTMIPVGALPRAEYFGETS